MSAMGPIQAAIAAKMTGDNTLTGMVTGIFDFRGIPPGQAFPYVTIGNSTEVPDHTFGTKGYEDTCMLHIWSIEPGTQECQQILKRLNELFDEQPLTIIGFNQIGTWYEMAQTLLDPDDTRITHMPVRYRIGAQASS